MASFNLIRGGKVVRQPIIARKPICTVAGQSYWAHRVHQDWKDTKEPIHDPASGYLKITKKDNGYFWPTITVIAQGDTLYVRLKSYTKGFTTRYLVIPHFNQFSAVEVIQTFPDLGRHFEDAIHQAYHTLGLPLGYVVPILKEV